MADEQTNVNGSTEQPATDQNTMNEAAKEKVVKKAKKVVKKAKKTVTPKETVPAFMTIHTTHNVSFNHNGKNYGDLVSEITVPTELYDEAVRILIEAYGADIIAE